MILCATAAKLKRRSRNDFAGGHFEAGLIVQAVSWYLRFPLSVHRLRNGTPDRRPIGTLLAQMFTIWS